MVGGHGDIVGLERVARICCRVLVKQVTIGRKANLCEGSTSGTCSNLCVLQVGDVNLHCAGRTKVDAVSC
jgi:hypothetical protein